MYSVLTPLESFNVASKMQSFTDPRNELLAGWMLDMFNKHLDSRFMRQAAPLLRKEIVEPAATADIDDLREYVSRLYSTLNELDAQRTAWKHAGNSIAFYCTPSTKPRPQTREAQQLANTVMVATWLLLQLKPILKGRLTPAD